MGPGVFLCLPWPWHFERYWLIFCRKDPWCPFDCCFHVIHAFWGKTDYSSDAVPFSMHHIWKSMGSICFISGDVDSCGWGGVFQQSSLYSDELLNSLSWIFVLQCNTLRQYKYHFLIILLPTNFGDNSLILLLKLPLSR